MKKKEDKKEDKKEGKKVFYIEEKNNLIDNIFSNVFIILNEFELNLKFYNFYIKKLDKYKLINDFIKDFDILNREYIEEYILQYDLPENIHNIKININTNIDNNFIKISIDNLNNKLFQILNYLKNNNNNMQIDDNIKHYSNLKFITNKIINLTHKILYSLKLEC